MEKPNSSNKVIIIIEDDYDDFKNIKSVVTPDFRCPQNYCNDSEFNQFRNKFQHSLVATHTDVVGQQKMKDDLLSELKSYCKENEEPIYLIDFLLDGENYNQSINGINFRKFILKELYNNTKEIPSLFITSIGGTDLDRVKTYCDEIKDNKVCDFKPKHHNWTDEDFKQGVIKFIKKAKAKAKEVKPISHNPNDLNSKEVVS